MSDRNLFKINKRHKKINTYHRQNAKNESSAKGYNNNYLMASKQILVFLVENMFF